MTRAQTGQVNRVDVRGGALHYERFGSPDGLPVIAAHGLTSHRSVWHRVVSFLPGTDFVAVDLRGRGDSRALPGPSSISQHVDDLVLLADALGSDRFILAGHSMGPFVALAFAAAHPDRTAGVVLVDGGITLPTPGSGRAEEAGEAREPREADETDGEPAVVSDLKTVLARLEETYSSREEYRDLWRGHPATGPYWNEAIAHYVDTDLHGTEPDLRPGASAARAREDMIDMFERTGERNPLDQLACPAVALRAERGLLDQPEGLYPTGWLQERAADQPLLEVREVQDVNHYTVLLEERAALQVAETIRELMARSAQSVAR